MITSLPICIIYAYLLFICIHLYIWSIYMDRDYGTWVVRTIMIIMAWGFCRAILMILILSIARELSVPVDIIIDIWVGHATHELSGQAILLLAHELSVQRLNMDLSLRSKVIIHCTLGPMSDVCGCVYVCVGIDSVEKIESWACIDILDSCINIHIYHWYMYIHTSSVCMRLISGLLNT